MAHNSLELAEANENEPAKTDNSEPKNDWGADQSNDKNAPLSRLKQIQGLQIRALAIAKEFKAHGLDPLTEFNNVIDISRINSKS